MSDDEKLPLSSVAKNNRNYLLEVARDLLARSPAASLHAIAKAAQVGPGTLYRHFTNHEMLLLAVDRLEIQPLVDAVPALLEQNPPLIALHLWFERLARDLRIKRGLRAALDGGASDSITRETAAPVIVAINVLLHACQSHGLIRSDIRAEDLLLLMGFMSRADVGPDGPAQVARLLRLTIDGLTVLDGKERHGLRGNSLPAHNRSKNKIKTSG